MPHCLRLTLPEDNSFRRFFAPEWFFAFIMVPFSDQASLRCGGLLDARDRRSSIHFQKRNPKDIPVRPQPDKGIFKPIRRFGPKAPPPARPAADVATRTALANLLGAENYS